MVFTHDLADHARALGIATIGAVAAVVHSIHHAAMHRFHTVAYIRQRTIHDHAHGVGEVRFAHFRRQITHLDAFADHQAVIGVVDSCGLSGSIEPSGTN